MKEGGMDETSHISYERGVKYLQNCFSGNLNGRNHLENMGVDLRIKLNWIFKK
jgi:hypothetical protein